MDKEEQRYSDNSGKYVTVNSLKTPDEINITKEHITTVPVGHGPIVIYPVAFPLEKWEQTEMRIPANVLKAGHINLHRMTKTIPENERGPFQCSNCENDTDDVIIDHEQPMYLETRMGQLSTVIGQVESESTILLLDTGSRISLISYTFLQM